MVTILLRGNSLAEEQVHALLVGCSIQPLATTFLLDFNIFYKYYMA